MATYYRWRKREFSYVLNQTQHLLSTNDPNTDYRLQTSSAILKWTKTQVSGNGPVDISGWNTRELTSDPYSLDSGYVAFAFVTRTNETSATNYYYVNNGRYIDISRSGTVNTVSIYASRVTSEYLYICTVTQNFGDTVEYVYSTSFSAYPNGGASGDYWYDQRTTVASPTAPSGLTYPNPITTPSVTVSWSAATSNVPSYAVNLYEVSYSTNGTSWTVAGTTAGTSLAVPIPAGTTSITFRVRARDSNNQWGSYVTGAAATVILAPTLTVPSLAMQGQNITVSWTAVDGADSYTVERKANTDTDWVQVYSGAALTFTETPGAWTGVQYRVQAVFGETSGGWATSETIPVRIPGVPNLTFSVSGEKISNVPGFDYIIVSFQSDIPYQAFECRATKVGQEYGVGKGNLVSSFSSTPANTQRQFEVYDDYLLQGDGEYRISLFAQGYDGSWNDNLSFVPVGETDTLMTADGKEFFVKR